MPRGGHRGRGRARCPDDAEPRDAERPGRAEEVPGRAGRAGRRAVAPPRSTVERHPELKSNAELPRAPEPARGARRTASRWSARRFNEAVRAYNTQIQVSFPAASSPPSADSSEKAYFGGRAPAVRLAPAQSSAPAAIRGRASGVLRPGTGDRAALLAVWRRAPSPAASAHPAPPDRRVRATSRGRWRRPIDRFLARGAPAVERERTSAGTRWWSGSSAHSRARVSRTTRSGSPRSGRSARKAWTTASYPPDFSSEDREDADSRSGYGLRGGADRRHLVRHPEPGGGPRFPQVEDRRRHRRRFRRHRRRPSRGVPRGRAVARVASRDGSIPRLDSHRLHPPSSSLAIVLSAQRNATRARAGMKLDGRLRRVGTMHASGAVIWGAGGGSSAVDGGFSRRRFRRRRPAASFADTRHPRWVRFLSAAGSGRVAAAVDGGGGARRRDPRPPPTTRASADLMARAVVIFERSVCTAPDCAG